MDFYNFYMVGTLTDWLNIGSISWQRQKLNQLRNQQLRNLRRRSKSLFSEENQSFLKATSLMAWLILLTMIFFEPETWTILP